MDALAALRLQLEWGADEALVETPVDRMAVAARPVAAPAATRARPAASAPSQLAAALRPPPHPAQTQALLPGAAPAPAARAQEIAAAARTLEELRAALERFDGCPLSATATNLVFADGNPDSGLMLVGEGPGADEDRIGKPFVGASGQFLDRMLASIGLDRSGYVITNLIPWRPPGNRNPTDNEVLVCLPFLLRHIALVRPRRLVLLGALATRAVTGSNTGIRRMRGRWLDVTIPDLPAPVPTLPMLHPAYLLRTPGAKREAWNDMLLLKRTMDDDMIIRKISES
ncbi:Type-4 uracil-DNA glycosylase [Rhodovastum atsumiense]|uniref:Type-4 uracil-DNA glycosylase n=1 Tax=Rhodovastum atsumiense TaxID=504468 RepID=A0A5M6IXG6_9PROT|nr:uracil-DNA glycosylase [Rhodovastum atsumiense]KAA5613034.1 uracil-DNA glycosylase [Rhodovastum atsumiense]CAH2600111.1 Type-4 uracil-DNA glycosylase [Rhodovastum atsumiense]